MPHFFAEDDYGMEPRRRGARIIRPEVEPVYRGYDDGGYVSRREVIEERPPPMIMKAPPRQETRTTVRVLHQGDPGYDKYMRMTESQAPPRGPPMFEPQGFMEPPMYEAPPPRRRPMRPPPGGPLGGFGGGPFGGGPFGGGPGGPGGPGGDSQVLSSEFVPLDQMSPDMLPQPQRRGPPRGFGGGMGGPPRFY